MNELDNRDKYEFEASQPENKPEKIADLEQVVRFFDDTTNARISPFVIEQLREMGVPYIIEGVTDRIRKSGESSAEKSRDSAVLALRIEADKRNVNDNLSALVQIGMQLFYAMVRGQHVVLSIDPNFESTIAKADPSVVAQYQALRLKIDRLSITRPELFTFLDNSDTQAFCLGVKDALERQKNPDTQCEPLTSEKLEKFLAARKKRLSKTNRRTTIGGSSSPYSPNGLRRFENNQRLITQIWEEAGDVTALNKGQLAATWSEAYAAGIDSKTRLKIMCEAFLSEQGHKDHNDILAWIIQNEAISKAAITEIGFLLLNAFESGQQVCLLIERFDADKYMQHLIKKNLPVLQASYPDEPLLKLPESEFSKITMERVAASDLSDSKVFKEAEMAQAVRKSVEHELQALRAMVKELIGDHSVELFSLSNDVTDYLQKCRLVSNPESAESRAEYYKNFDTFKEHLTDEVVQHQGRREEAVPSIARALERTSKIKRTRPVIEHLRKAKEPGVQEEEAPLLAHLRETSETALLLTPFAIKTDRDGRNFLSPEKMKLFVEVIAPIHDLLKFLGGPESQALPDHEVLISYIANEYLPAFGYTPEEAEFVAMVLGNHENIYKESGRDKFSKSDLPAERGMSLFFMIDLLTGALIDRGEGVLDLDDSKLDNRLTDLYFRHMDPVARKINLPRPEWGVASAKDLVELCRTLSEQYGVKLADGFLRRIVDSMLKGIERTFAANVERKQAGGPLLDTNQLLEIMDAQSTLQKLRAEVA